MTQKLPQVTVGLYFVGETLDPATVTSVLKLNPSKEQKKGQEFVTASGREFKAKTGSWALTVQMEPAALELHLRRLLDSLPKPIPFAQLPGVETAFLDIFVAATSGPTGEASCQFDIPSDLTSELGEVGLHVKFAFTAGPD